MSDNTYYGWTNRHTWLINLWFEPQTVEDVEMARSHFDETIEGLPNWLTDFIPDDINWDEIIRHVEDHETLDN